MKKPDSLRAFVTAALADDYPDLRTDPERLQIFIEKGRVAASGTPGLALQYSYDLALTLFDFPGDPDAVFVPVVAWLGRHQPELLQSHATNGAVLRFEVDIVSRDKADLQITLPLTESITATCRADGPGYDVVAHPDPEPDEAVARAGESFEIWFDGKSQIAWTQPLVPEADVP